MLPTELPETLPEFLARFGTDEACRDHLFAQRWPKGFCCDCGNMRYYLLSVRTNVYECSRCGAQHSLLAGTIFEQTKTGLSKWFLAIYLFTGSKGGISALELKRHLGFGSDQTAWTWLHKIRRAMSVRGAPLVGPVEVDETFLGGASPVNGGVARRARRSSRAPWKRARTRSRRPIPHGSKALRARWPRGCWNASPRGRHHTLLPWAGPPRHDRRCDSQGAGRVYKNFDRTKCLDCHRRLEGLTRAGEQRLPARADHRVEI